VINAVILGVDGISMLSTAACTTARASYTPSTCWRRRRRPARGLPLSIRKTNLARVLAGHGIFVAPFEQGGIGPDCSCPLAAWDLRAWYRNAVIARIGRAHLGLDVPPPPCPEPLAHCRWRPACVRVLLLGRLLVGFLALASLALSFVLGPPAASRSAALSGWAEVARRCSLLSLVLHAARFLDGHQSPPEAGEFSVWRRNADC
jgi:hypothetical protein